MTNALHCDECEAILREVGDAFAEMSPELANQFLSNRRALLRAIGRTSIDPDAFDELLEKHPFRAQLPGSAATCGNPYAKVHDAVRKLILHRFHTGHVPLNLFNR